MTAARTSTTTTKASSSSSSSLSPSEISKQIKSLIEEVPEIRADSTRLDELRRLYTKLEADGEIEFNNAQQQQQQGEGGVALEKWKSFLLKNHKIMVSQLCDRVSLGRHTAVRCMWGVIAASPMTKKIRNQTKNDGLSSSSYKYVNIGLLQKWLRAVTKISNNNNESVDSQNVMMMDRQMRHMIESEFLHQYRDVQYYALKCITQLAEEQYNNINVQNANTSSSRKKKSNTKKSVEEVATASRLMELLLMIPVPGVGLGWGDDDDDHEDDGNNYLFPPPKDVIPDDDDDDDSEDDVSVNDDSENEEDEDSSEEDDDDNDDEEVSERPTKRRKKARRPTKANNNNRICYQNLKLFRREYQRAWLTILKLPSLPSSHLKRALNFLPNDVLMNVPNPLRFSDFFIQAYGDHDSGVIGVLALDGLFLLITEHGLEYPDFYKQLYKLVSSRVLHAKYRVRFFTLLNKCLALNEMLPAHLIAAFAKRLVRSALNGPPAGILFVLALVSNLLRKHPECSCLVHRKKVEDIDDPFLPKENDPVESRAIQSSLWELDVLERHYHPAVVTLAKSVGTSEEMNAPMHDIDAFVSHTYKDLFDQERKKKTKKTALTFKEPSGLFVEGDMFSDVLKCA